MTSRPIGRFCLLLVVAAAPLALTPVSHAPAQGIYNPNAPPAPVPQGVAPPAGQQAAPVPSYQNTNPVCARLEGQLGAIDRGQGDPGRAAALQRGEAIMAKQQSDLDRLVAQQRKLGCQSAGIFSIFINQPPQCNALNNQIEQARTALDRTTSDYQRIQSGGAGDQETQRQQVITQLAQNNCGPQYRAAAQPRGILDSIFGGGNNNFGGNSMYGGVDVSQGGTFKTVCVRTCDGYYYPISFATTAARFADDERTCRATCPASEVVLYTHRTNEDIRQAVAANGRPYSDLPNAFRYRTQFDPACSCRKAGQSWSDALGQTKDTTVQGGDIVVTDEKAKALSQPKANPRGARQATPAPTTAGPANGTPASAIDSRSIRTVGPTPYPVR